MAAGQAQGHLACHRWDPLDLKSDASFFFVVHAYVCVCVRASRFLLPFPPWPSYVLRSRLYRSLRPPFIHSITRPVPACSVSFSLFIAPSAAQCRSRSPVHEAAAYLCSDTPLAPRNSLRTHTSCSFNILIPSHFLFHPPSTSRSPAPDYLCLRRVCTLPPPTSSPVSRDGDGIQMSFNYLCNRHSLEGS